MISSMNVLSAAWQALLDRWSPQRKITADIRSKWGQPGKHKTWGSGAHFDLTRGAASAMLVDDKTWNDLEFPEIFSRLDTTSTPIGRQYLFSMMRTYADDSRLLAERYASANMLRTNAVLREQIQLVLAALKDDGHADMADLVFGDPPQTVKYPKLLLCWSMCSLLVVIGAIASLWTVWLALAAIAANVVIMARLYWTVQRDATALKRCLGMLPVAAALSAISMDGVQFDALRELREQIPLRHQLQKKLQWLVLLQKDSVQFISIWINVAFLAELSAYTHALKHFAQLRSTLQSTWELLGSIDATVAMACCLERFPEHCVPDISSAALIDIRDGYHPLLASPVRNSLCLDGRSALIAGSNMAGKTTMIKMVGINIILGRTLGFCLASSASIPLSSVMASIRSEHSVESGKSHYFAEIERLQAFIECAGRDSCKVFVIDELFSGTNTIERIAIARAVLEQLAMNAQVLVTTHDVELQQDLSADYDLYHFQENPDIEGFFDYKLMPGAAVERNAIRLLARVGFPETVMARARSFVTEK